MVSWRDFPVAAAERSTKAAKSSPYPGCPSAESWREAVIATPFGLRPLVGFLVVLVSIPIVYGIHGG